MGATDLGSLLGLGVFLRLEGLNLTRVQGFRVRGQHETPRTTPSLHFLPPFPKLVSYFFLQTFNLAGDQHTASSLF